MNSKPNSIHNSGSSNGNCKITLMIPESENNETDSSSSTETLAVEHAIEKLASTENYASRKKKQVTKPGKKKMSQQNLSLSDGLPVGYRRPIHRYQVRKMIQKINVVALICLTIIFVSPVLSELSGKTPSIDSPKQVSRTGWTAYNMVALGSAIFVVGVGLAGVVAFSFPLLAYKICYLLGGCQNTLDYYVDQFVSGEMTSGRSGDNVEDEDGNHKENEVENAGDKENIDGVDGSMKVRIHQYDEMEEVFLDGDADATEDQTLKKPSNGYAAKKTVAQGMMDIALITANANQLRYMVEYNQHSPTYYINLILISFSLVLQVGIGVALIMKGRLDMKGRSKGTNAKRINNYVIIGVFMVTIINVFIASFTVTGSAPTVVVSVPATTLV